MDLDYLKTIIGHLRPDYGYTRVETQGSEDQLRRRKYNNLDALVDDISRRHTSASGKVYFSPHGYNTGDYDSTAQHVGASRCLYHDIDIDPSGQIVREGRDPVPCYATKEEAYAAACAVVDHAQLPRPTAVIDSGRGLHLYWRLTADIHPNDFAMLGNRMKELWRQRDTRLAADLSRGSTPGELMRAPGSINHKSNTYVWIYNGIPIGGEVERTVFEERLPLAPDTVRIAGVDGGEAGNILSTSESVTATIKDVHDNCRLFRLMWAFPARFSSYAAWQHSMMIFQSTPDINDGLREFHNYCSRMPNYDADEVNAEFAKANFRGKPVSCTALRAVTGVGNKACQGCPVFERHPNGGTCLKAKQIADLAANVAAEQARPQAEPVQIQSLAAPNVQIAPPASAFEGPVISEQMWRSIPGQTLPRAKYDEHNPMPGFYYDDNLNLIHVTLDEVETALPPDPVTGEIKTTIARVPVVDVIYQGMYVWIETKVMAGRQADHSFANVRCARGNINAPTFATIQIPLGILNDMRAVTSKLLAAGVAVNMNKERHLQSHLNAQLGMADEITAATRFGWTDDKPTADSGFVVSGTLIKGATGMSEVANIGRSQPQMDKFCLRGSLDDHMKVLGTYSRNGVGAAKAMIAAAVAAPLYHVLNQGSFMVSITGESGSGKSRLLAVLQALWGYNDGNLMSGNDTLNAIMNQLNMCNGIGAFMDEITNMGNEDFTQLAMSVTNGRERNRLNSSAQLREAEGKWNLPVFCTSNRPLVDKIIGFDAGGDAARARVMDLPLVHNGQLVDRVLQNMTHAEVSELDRMAVANTGFVGVAVVQYIVQNFDSLSALIRQVYTDLDSKAAATQRFSAAMGACAIVGDKILKALMGTMWQTGDTEMSSIVSRMMAQSSARREQHSLDPLRALVAHLADRGDRVMRTRPARGRNSNGHLQVVGGTAANSTLRVDISDDQIEARVDIGARSRSGRQVTVLVTQDSMRRLCLSYGIDVNTFLHTAAVSSDFTEPTDVRKPEFYNLYDGVGGQGSTRVNSLCYKFVMELSLDAAAKLFDGVDDSGAAAQAGGAV